MVIVPDQMPMTPRQNIPAGPTAEAKSSLSHLLELLGRNKWKALVFITLVTVAAGVISLQLEPLYESTTVVRVERNSTEGMVGMEAGAVMPVNDMDQVMATQAEVVQSDPVLRPVAEKYNLLEREKQFKGLSSQQIAKKRMAPVFLKRLKVTRPPNTYLMRITYGASDPVFAATIANEIALSYIKHAFDSKDKAYDQISASINHELADLRARMEKSTYNLANFEKELSMIDPAQGTNIMTGRLLQLNNEFTTAQAERLKAEAAEKALADAGTVAAAQATVPPGQLDHTLERLNEARQQFAAIKSIYGENYSEYRKAKEQVDELQRQVDQMRADTLDRVKVQYASALGREQRLQTAVNAAKVEVNGINAKALQYEQMKRDAENDKKLYEDLERRAAESNINNRFQDAVIQVSSPALPAFRKAFPSIPLNLAVAFLLSSILSVIWIVIANAVDTTLSDPEEVATRLNVEVLGVIPATRNLASVAQIAENRLPQRSAKGMERFTEAIRGLRTSIDLANLDRPVRSVLITSAEPSEGKSTTAAHLALSFAQIGKRVLLLDADLRAPTAHRHFLIRSDLGLSDILTGKASWREATIKIKPYDLFVMPAGPVSRRAADAFATGVFELFDQISGEYDIVIVDAPPLLGFSETHQLARMADSVVVVAKAGKTRGKAVARAFATLFRAGANVMGLVMAQVKPSSLNYGYGYGYGKYHSPADPPKAGELASS